MAQATRIGDKYYYFVDGKPIEESEYLRMQASSKYSSAPQSTIAPKLNQPITSIPGYIPEPEPAPEPTQAAGLPAPPAGFKWVTNPDGSIKRDAKGNAIAVPGSPSNVGGVDGGVGRTPVVGDDSIFTGVSLPPVGSGPTDPIVGAPIVPSPGPTPPVPVAEGGAPIVPPATPPGPAGAGIDAGIGADIIVPALETGKDIVTGTGTEGTAGIPETDLAALRTTQRGYAGDIATSKTETAKDVYDKSIAAIDAAALELTGGIDTAQALLKEQGKEFDPYIKFGTDALTDLETENEDLFRKFTLEDFTKTPAYELRKAEGESAILNRGSALGVTGQTAKDLIKYGEDYAYDAFGKERNYFTDTQNRRINYLTGAANMGLGALGTQTGVVGDIAKLDIGRGEVKGQQETLLGEAGVRKSTDIGGADVEKLQTFSDIESDYFANKFGLEESRRLGKKQDTQALISNILGGAGLGYKIGGPWGALAGGAGGAAVNYFAR